MSILLEPGRLDEEALRLLSSTSHEMRDEMANHVAKSFEHFDVFNRPDLTEFVLSPVMLKKNKTSHRIAYSVTTHVGYCDPRKKINLRVVEQLLSSVLESGYDNKAHLMTASSNATFFANHAVLEVMMSAGFPVSDHTYAKLKEKLNKFSLKKNNELPIKMIKSQYQDTLQVIVDNKLIDDVEERLLALLRNIKELIKNHPFELSGGGDKSIAEIGHPVSASAAEVFRAIDAELQHPTTIVWKYKKLAEKITGKLSVTKKEGWFTSYGGRATSTTQLYTKIISMVGEGLRILREINVKSDSDDDDEDFEFSV
jgi:hypothetical protein